ncbi:MAG: hypothetical protein KY455_05700 [Euryarchaeota archaeon]|nr:hypothetical protein [Euryarchaeota archaeon]
MSETFTPMQAAKTFAEARRWEDSLVRRTEGLTWMVWGMVTAGIFGTLGLLVFLEIPPVLVVAGWSVWAMAGLALTFVIWRTAALLGRNEFRPIGWKVYVTKVLVLASVVLFLHFVVRPESIIVPMLLVGIIWGTVALFGRRLSLAGRIVSLVSSLVILGMAIALDSVVLPMTQAMFVGVSLMAGIPFLAGLYQALRG